MHFHFSTINHNAMGRSSLGDMADWFRAGLSELGHRVSLGHDIDTRAVNVFWECFFPGMAEALVESRITYGIVATEIPDGTGFNWRTDAPWPLRYASFADVARGASFIWTMVESTLPFYHQFAPCSYTELGFSERLVPPKEILDAAPRYDFGFFGVQTPHRDRVAEELSKHAHFAWAPHLATTADIIGFISSVKIGLNFRQSPQWPIPSPTRLGRYLHSKRAVVSEYVPTPTRQGAFVTIAEEGADFAASCLEALDSEWQARAQLAYERYRAEMPMKEIMERALDATMKNVRSPWWRRRGSIQPPALLGDREPHLFEPS